MQVEPERQVNGMLHMQRMVHSEAFAAVCWFLVVGRPSPSCLWPVGFCTESKVRDPSQ